MNLIPLYRQCSHEKPPTDEPMVSGSLFMAVCGGFQRKPPQNTFDKGPFLLVRFLWANKENEQAIISLDYSQRNLVVSKAEWK